MRSSLALLIVSMLLVGCQPLSVNYQTDPFADFSQYQRFDWMPEKTPSSDAGQALLEKQLRFSVERELQSKGLVLDSQSPDFLISYYGSEQQRSTERTIENTDYWGDRGRYALYDDPKVDDYMRRWRYDPGSYTRSIETQTIEYKEGTLVIDFIDANTKQPVWQATVQGVIDEQDPAGQLDRAVIKALEAFPPSK